MKKMIIEFIKDERGSSELIETAVALQITLALILGMIFFILAAKDDVIMESAARSGAREYGITGERGAAYTKAYEDLEIGRVKGASVYFEGDSIVVYKKLRFNVPFVDKYNFGIKKSSKFHREDDTWYFDKPPELQGSPVDGYSGYTGNPYR